MSRCVFLPDELITEILSFLPVKSLMRLKWVSKSWNKFISDPTFVQLHLHRSARKRHIAVIEHGLSYTDYYNVLTFPLNHLLENPSITVAHRLTYTDYTLIVGSCNGLVCFLGHSYSDQFVCIWFRIWNPATGILSEKLGSFNQPRNGVYCRLRFTFGYDNSTKTYKVVLLISSSEVKVFSLSDNIWRTISSFPPFDHIVTLGSTFNEGVYLSGTVNWFAIRSKSSYNNCQKDITVEQFVIISLDLSTETYKQIQTPRGVAEVPNVEPTIAVLMDCLCFSHYLKRTHFVIWRMLEFGVEQSWTQFIKISFQNLQVDDRFSDWIDYQSFMFPLCLSENGNTLILVNSRKGNAILYHLKDNRVEQASGNEITWTFAKDYVESLASIC